MSCQVCQGTFQQDEAYWKDFAAKWTQKIEDSDGSICPIYQTAYDIDEPRK